MKKLIYAFLSIVLLLTLVSCDEKANNNFSDNPANNMNNSSNNNSVSQKQLSSECDIVLCDGYDYYANHYELVGNQIETSKGFEITLGVIKNNTWLMPLSSKSDFLGDDGLFDVNYTIGGHKAVDIYAASSFFRFVETGGFVMESTEEESGLFGKTRRYYIFFSCSSTKYLKIDRDEYHIGFVYSETSGDMWTDSGKIIAYKETSGSSDGSKLTYDWYTLDTSSLQMNKFASGMKNLYPKSILSEGLIFASDKCFYDTKMNKKIDLSDYNIDLWYDGNQIYFIDGKCVFTVKNQLGTSFEITIDKTGKVLSEVQK